MVSVIFDIVTRTPSVIGAVGLIYGLIVGAAAVVAVFDPDPERRADARKVLEVLIRRQA